MVTAAELMPYRWQYCRDGYDITHEMYAEDDADEVRAWDGAHGDTCIVAVQRTPRGRWRIETSDYSVPVSAYDRRFGSPLEAVQYMARRARMQPAEAVCRCGSPGEECD